LHVIPRGDLGWSELLRKSRPFFCSFIPHRHRPHQALLDEFAILLVSSCSLLSHISFATLIIPIPMASANDDTLTKVSTEGEPKENLGSTTLSHGRN
jgi:hypothetical protein